MLNNFDRKKQFYLFQCNSYYPNGGLTNITGTYDSLFKARQAASTRHYDWSEILDRVNGEIYDAQD